MPRKKGSPVKKRPKKIMAKAPAEDEVHAPLASVASPDPDPEADAGPVAPGEAEAAVDCATPPATITAATTTLVADTTPAITPPATTTPVVTPPPTITSANTPSSTTTSAATPAAAPQAIMTHGDVGPSP